MNVREKRTENYLKELGFLVHTVTKPSRQFMNHDIFGLWDHIAFAQKDIEFMGNIHNVGSLLLVQTKSVMLYGKQLIPFYNFISLPKTKYLFVWVLGKNKRYSLTIKELVNESI